MSLSFDHQRPSASGVAESIAAAREGSESALGLLLDCYRDYLLRLARDELKSVLVPKIAHSDLVQETFLQAARDFPKFAGTTETELRAWLRKNMRHNLLDAAKRHETAQKRSVKRELSLEAGPGISRSVWSIASTDPSPSTQASATETRAAVHSAMRQLPEDYRRVIELRSFAGLTFEAAGDELGRSSEAAQLWSRAIEELGRLMGTHDLRRPAV